MFHKVRIIPSDTTRLHPPYSYSRQMELATKPFSEEFNDGANLITVLNESSWMTFASEQHKLLNFKNTCPTNRITSSVSPEPGRK